MRTIRLTLLYDGTELSGWQAQGKGERTVEDILGRAVGKVTGTNRPIIAAGRTDAGVHALGQVAAFETDCLLDGGALKRALNANLPRDIRVEHAEEAPAGFHPRFDARGKRYRYLLLNRRESCPFMGRYTWQVPVPLDVERMAGAGDALVGRHDFSSFQASGCTARHPVREIRNLLVDRLDQASILGLSLRGPVVSFVVEGDAFLRHMVRNVVGTLVEVGRGRISPGTVRDILAARDRRAAGPTAPGQGLFLEKVFYEGVSSDVD